MTLGRFANETMPSCTSPLLDASTFGEKGGYIPGRYCGLGSFSNGTTCCFPCPLQDWVYPPEWKAELRVPNYLSILSLVLCCFLLLSFAVLPPEQTHRHYLSIGLLFPVLFISLSFAIPVSVDPPLCFDAITPNDLRSNTSCVWTGALVTLGGLGCVVWVFLRSLWLHIRIFWDRDPGRRFKYGSIVFGILVPSIFLIALLAKTGFSYRMGQTCLPNHENAIITFWIWLVGFAITGFILQAATTGYCIYVYMRTLRREKQSSRGRGLRNNVAKDQTWKSVKNLMLLQWRNIFVSIFVIVGSISFFVVFWSQDAKLGDVFNDPKNLKPVKIWILCLTLSRGDKEECMRYVSDFTVSRITVLASLILASLVGIEIFILLFRRSMITAWKDLLSKLLHRARTGRPPTPELTSFENAEDPDNYLSLDAPKRPGFASSFSADTPSTISYANNSPSERHSGLETSPSHRNSRIQTPKRTSAPPRFRQPSMERVTIVSDLGLGVLPSYTNENDQPSDRDNAPSHESRTTTPVQVFRIPSPLQRSKRFSWGSSSGSMKNTPLRISNPVPGTLVHVNGAFVGSHGGAGNRLLAESLDSPARIGRATPASSPVPLLDWENEEVEGWEGWGSGEKGFKMV